MILERESKIYTPKEKAEIMAFYKQVLEKLPQAKARIEVIKKFGVHYSTVRGWQKRDEIKKKYEQAIHR